MSSVTLVVALGPSKQQVCVGGCALQKQMKYLERQQDESKQAREEAHRLRGKMKTLER